MPNYTGLMPNYAGMVPYRSGGKFATRPGGGSIRVQFRAVAKIPGNKLFKKRPAELVGDMERITLRHAMRVMDTVREYPGGGLANPHRIGAWRGSTFHRMPSGYRRTGTLYANWKIFPRNAGGSFAVTISNNAVDENGRAYANYVQGPRQVSYHRKAGWKRIDDPRNLKQGELTAKLNNLMNNWAYGGYA